MLAFLKNIHFRLRLPLLWICIFAQIVAGCESKKTIVNGLDEREANEILVFLAAKNIPAYKIPSAEGGGSGSQKTFLWDIQIDEPNSLQAMSLLNIAGLPRKRSKSLLNIFSGGGLVPSQLEEKIRFQAGLAEQIASTIRKIDGVLDADVQLSFPEEDPLNPNAKKEAVSASVYIKHAGVLEDPNSHLITKIRRLVASSIPGLSYDNVTVVPDRARLSEGQADGTLGFIPPEKPLVAVWGITIAKESLYRFQLIFFSFIAVLFLLFLFFLWLFWKVHLLFPLYGGYASLFSPQPYLLKKASFDKENEKEKKSAEENKKSKDKSEESKNDDDDEDDEDEDDEDENEKIGR